MSVLFHYLGYSLKLARATTQTSDAERNCLAKHAAAKHRLAEIGTWHGVTTSLLRRSMSPVGLLYAIDPYPVGRLGLSFQKRIAEREVGRVANGAVIWLRLTGVEAARLLKESSAPPVDFVFIDGDHSYEGLRGDWEEWSPLVGPGGIVALHDSVSCPARSIDGAGSVRYTAEVIAHDPRFRPVETVDTLSVFQRI
jgi:predicted O-methyltransferase YrrM